MSEEDKYDGYGAVVVVIIFFCCAVTWLTTGLYFRGCVMSNAPIEDVRCAKNWEILLTKDDGSSAWYDTGQKCGVAADKGASR